MTDFFNLIGSLVTTWWDFIFSTYVPRTNFTFGGLYCFILALSIFIFLVRVSLKHKEGDSK